MREPISVKVGRGAQGGEGVQHFQLESNTGVAWPNPTRPGQRRGVPLGPDGDETDVLCRLKRVWAGHGHIGDPGHNPVHKHYNLSLTHALHHPSPLSSPPLILPPHLTTFTSAPTPAPTPAPRRRLT